jgi:hypothetical protein
MSEETSTAQPAAPEAADPTAAPAGGNPTGSSPSPAPSEAGTPGLSFTYQDAALEQVFGKVGADGRPENVNAKYWDADKKAIKADVVLNQLRWAESKIGKKIESIGAPEQYELQPTEKLSAEVLQGFAEDPRLSAVFEKAKSLDLSGSAMQELVGAFLEQDMAASDEIMQAELKSLGENAPQRLKDLSDWLDASVEPVHRQALKDLCTSAAAVEAVESLMRAAQPPKFNQANAQQAPIGPSREDWEKMYFARDDRGQRLVQTDPAYAKRVEQLRDKVFGTERRDSNGRRIA